MRLLVRFQHEVIPKKCSCMLGRTIGKPTGLLELYKKGGKVNWDNKKQQNKSGTILRLVDGQNSQYLLS